MSQVIGFKDDLMAHAQLSDRKFVLTGPSGWIGQAVLSRLCAALGPLSGRVTAFASSERSMTLVDGQAIHVRALDTIRPDDVDGAHVIHLAYLTKDRVDALGEVEFRKMNTAIDSVLLSALNEARPASIFVASSGAAGLAEAGQDLNPYGIAKLEQEERFLSFGKTRGVPVICGRVFNIAGPYINKLMAYAISNFVVQAMQGGPIRISAPNPVFRSFLHVDDLCDIILRASAALSGSSNAIDICGTEVLEMQQLAQLVADCIDQRVKIERPPLNYSHYSSYLGRSEETISLAMSLGVVLKGAREQVADTVRWLSQSGLLESK